MTSTISFGSTTKPLTVTQEAVIATLYLAEMKENQYQHKYQVLYVNGQFFIHALGIVFESYHRELMRDLERLGWIKVIRRHGTLYYCLTETGRSTKSGHFRDSRKCTMMKNPAPF